MECKGIITILEQGYAIHETALVDTTLLVFQKTRAPYNLNLVELQQHDIMRKLELLCGNEVHTMPNEYTDLGVPVRQASTGFTATQSASARIVPVILNLFIFFVLMIAVLLILLGVASSRWTRNPTVDAHHENLGFQSYRISDYEKQIIKYGASGGLTS